MPRVDSGWPWRELPPRRVASVSDKPGRALLPGLFREPERRWSRAVAVGHIAAPVSVAPPRPSALVCLRAMDATGVGQSATSRRGRARSFPSYCPDFQSLATGVGHIERAIPSRDGLPLVAYSSRPSPGHPLLELP